MKLGVHPLTPDRLPALAELFHDNRTTSCCWCMYWRIGSAYRNSCETNQTAFENVVKQGPPPGLLAFIGDIPVGWCQLTPRATLPYLDKTRQLPRIDDVPVWSISCFYIRKGFRKRGVTHALIAKALQVAKRAGAPAVEAYPLDADVTPSSSFTGYLSTFQRAGFKIIARPVPSRPIVRYEFSKTPQSPKLRRVTK